MYIDKQTLLSDDQAVTVTAASSNSYDFGNDNALVQALNSKGNIGVLAQVHTAFAGGTSLKLTIESSDSSTFSITKVIYDSGVVLTATLIAGYKFPISGLPRIDEEYIRAYYTVVGTMSAGKVAVGLILDEQTNGV